MLVWRFFRQEWRSGSAWILLLSVALSVAIISAMLTFTGQMKDALAGEAARFIAADRVLASSRPIPLEWEQHARDSGLSTASFAVFPSMVYVGDTSSLAVVKAVSDGYPLRGSLLVADGDDAVPHAVQAGPRPGEAWLEARLLQSLGAHPGDMVSVGEQDLRITAILTNEPDGGNRLSMMAPRLMMSASDLAATGVVQPGSRVEYSLLVAGNKSTLQTFSDWLQPRLQVWHRWGGLAENRPAVSRALDRAGAFLLLSAALAVLLAAAATWLASRDYAHRQRQAVAVLKTLGAGTQALHGLYAQGLLAAGGLSVLAGWLLAAGFNQLLRQVFSPLLSLPWPRPEASGYLVGAGVGAFCLLLFVGPRLWRLADVPPDSLLREAGEQPRRDLTLLPGLLLLGAFASVLSGAWQLGLVFWLAVAGLLVILGGLLRGLLVISRRFRPLPGTALSLAMAAWQRRPWATVLQLAVFAIGFALVATVGAMRSQLLQDWQRQLPAGTPNYFLLNIAPGEEQAVAGVLASHGVQTAGLYPMIRGRLVGVNGQPPVQHAPAGRQEEAGWSLDRELNLSWSAALPADNTLVAGQWWDTLPADHARVSVEAGIAERLGLAIGDRLQFNVGGTTLEAEVSSVRKLDWETMRPNFFFLFSPGWIDQYPATWMTSFHATPGEDAWVAGLGRQFPTVSVIDVGAILAQVRVVIGQVSLAMQAVFALMLVAGILVLLAVLQSGLAQRRWESALLKSLGASPSALRQALWLEFAIQGAVAGLLGVAITEIVLWQVATRMLSIVPAWHPALWWQWPLAGAVLVGCTGFARLLPALRVPPSRVLQMTHTGE